MLAHLNCGRRGPIEFVPLRRRRKHFVVLFLPMRVAFLLAQLKRKRTEQSDTCARWIELLEYRTLTAPTHLTLRTPTTPGTTALTKQTLIDSRRQSTRTEADATIMRMSDLGSRDLAANFRRSFRKPAAGKCAQR